MGRYPWLSSNCCPAYAWVRLAHVSAASLCLVSPYSVRFLGLPDNLMIYSGMALGYQDGAAPSIPGALRALPSTSTHRSRASIAGGRQAFTSVQVAFTGSRLTPYLCRFPDSSRPCCCWAPSAPRPWGPMALTARVSQEPNNELR